MRNGFITILIIALFLSTGCSDNKIQTYNYTFAAENEEWEVEYNVNAKREWLDEYNSKTESSDILTATYKKDIFDFDEAEVIKISYEVGAGSRGGNLTLNFDKDPPQRNVFRLKSASKGAAIISEDDTITVTIEVDDKTQVLELTKVN